MGKKSKQEAVASCGVMHLDAETSLAPVPPLRVVAAERILLVKRDTLPSTVTPMCARADNPSQQLMPCLHETQHDGDFLSRGQSYRMVLSVRRRIHWGMGRFCFFALASFCFVRKDLWLCGRSWPVSVVVSHDEVPFSHDRASSGRACGAALARTQQSHVRSRC